MCERFWTLLPAGGGPARPSLRIMFADEARFGRIVRPRPCWAPIGTRPEVEPAHSRIDRSVRRSLAQERLLRLSDHADVEHRVLQAFLQRWRKVRRRKSCWFSTALPTIAAAIWRFPPTSRSCTFRPIHGTQSEGNLWDEIREKIFKNYALKSIRAVRAKLKQAILYIERIPNSSNPSPRSPRSSNHSM